MNNETKLYLIMLFTSLIFTSFVASAVRLFFVKNNDQYKNNISNFSPIEEIENIPEPDFQLHDEIANPQPDSIINQ